MSETTVPTDQPTTDTHPTGRTLCRHIRAIGRRCRMIALRDQHFCFYHHAARTPVPRIGVPRYPDQDRDPFALPVLEDRTAIQLALSQVLARIAANDLDPKRAGLLLYGLQIATSALPREPRKPIQPKDEYEDINDHEEVEDTHETGHPDSTETTTQLSDEIELDPTYGTLAPITPFIPPQPDSEERGLTPFERYLRDTNKALCPQCQTIHAKPKPEPQPNLDPNQQPHPEILRILQATADLKPERFTLPPHCRTVISTGARKAQQRNPQQALAVACFSHPTPPHPTKNCHFDRTLSDRRESKGKRENPATSLLPSHSTKRVSYPTPPKDQPKPDSLARSAQSSSRETTASPASPWQSRHRPSGTSQTTPADGIGSSSKSPRKHRSCVAKPDAQSH